MVIGFLRLSDVSVICRDVNSRPTCPKILWVRSVYGLYWPGDDFELIPMVKIETGNPAQGYFGNEFPEICNHWGVMAAWIRKTLNIYEKFLLRFIEKATP